MSFSFLSSTFFPDSLLKHCSRQATCLLAFLHLLSSSVQHLGERPSPARPGLMKMLHLQGYIVAPLVSLLQQTWICNFCSVCCSLKCKDTPTPGWFCLSVRCRSLWRDEIWQRTRQSRSSIHSDWINFILFELFCLVLVTSTLLLTVHSSCIAQVITWLIHLANLQRKRFPSVLIFHGSMTKPESNCSYLPCEAPEEDKGEIQEATSDLGSAREILSDLDAIFTLTHSDPVHYRSAFTFMTSERFFFFLLPNVTWASFIKEHQRYPEVIINP